MKPLLYWLLKYLKRNILITGAIIAMPFICILMQVILQMVLYDYYYFDYSYIIRQNITNSTGLVLWIVAIVLLNNLFWNMKTSLLSGKLSLWCSKRKMYFNLFCFVSIILLIVTAVCYLWFLIFSLFGFFSWSLSNYNLNFSVEWWGLFVGIIYQVVILTSILLIIWSLAKTPATSMIILSLITIFFYVFSGTTFPTFILNSNIVTRILSNLAVNKYANLFAFMSWNHLDYIPSYGMNGGVLNPFNNFYCPTYQGTIYNIFCYADSYEIWLAWIATPIVAGISFSLSSRLSWSS